MLPSLAQLHDILFSEDVCIEFSFEKKVLDTPSRCPLCAYFMKREGRRFRCRSKLCRHSFSILQGSFFANTHLKCNEVMLLCYLWLTKASSAVMQKVTGHSKQAVCDYRRFCMQLVAETLEDDDTIIGGQDVVVEVDETKLGKRKYHRGHRVEGVWVLVGVERTAGRKVFVETISDRSADTLLDAIKRHVAPGSVIHTDLWKGYGSLKDEGFIHRTVNHSICFSDPETEVHTNTVEGTNCGLKIFIAPRNRNIDDMDDRLGSFVWFRKHEADLWNGFIDAMSKTLYVNDTQ
jgi:transposase-like protein